MKFIVCRSDWQEFIDAQNRQAVALERVAAAVEQSLDADATLKDLTVRVKDETAKLSSALPPTQGD